MHSLSRVLIKKFFCLGCVGGSVFSAAYYTTSLVVVVVEDGTEKGLINFVHSMRGIQWVLSVRGLSRCFGQARTGVVWTGEGVSPV